MQLYLKKKTFLNEIILFIKKSSETSKYTWKFSIISSKYVLICLNEPWFFFDKGIVTVYFSNLVKKLFKKKIFITKIVYRLKGKIFNS